jgi:hypothetical protein
MICTYKHKPLKTWISFLHRLKKYYRTGTLWNRFCGLISVELDSQDLDNLGMLYPDPCPHQSENLDPDSDPHQGH